MPIVYLSLTCLACSKVNAVPYSRAELELIIDSPERIFLYSPCHNAKSEVTHEDRQMMRAAIAEIAPLELTATAAPAS